MGQFSNILLVSDFDRTLTDPHGQIPQTNLDAIRAFEAEGGAFTVATGRSVPMFWPHHKLIPNNAPLILYNGAAMYDYATRTVTETVELPGAEALLRDLYSRFPDLWLEIQGIDYHYLFRENEMRDAFYRSNHAAAKHITLEQLPSPLPKVALFGTFYDETVGRFFDSTPEEAARFDEVIAYLQSTYGKRLGIDRAASRIIDIQEKSVNKGDAARRLANRLGRPVLVCAGDAPNDVSMLEEADYAFVPEDCTPEVRDMGYPSVCACNEGAIAHIIRLLRSDIAQKNL